jgi:hypothetical protein
MIDFQNILKKHIVSNVFLDIDGVINAMKECYELGQKKHLIKEVRFADDDTFHEMEINMKEFNLSSEYETELFGWYKGSFICIKK